MGLPPGEEPFQRLARAFDTDEVHRTGRTLQAVRLPENTFDNLHLPFRREHFFQLDQPGRNRADMFFRLDLKGCEKSFQKLLILLSHFLFSDSVVDPRRAALTVKVARRFLRRLSLPCSALPPDRQLPTLSSFVRVRQCSWPHSLFVSC